MTYFTCFFLDNEKDIIVNLYRDLDRMLFVLLVAGTPYIQKGCGGNDSTWHDLPNRPKW